jgi:hypothetical protein
MRLKIDITSLHCLAYRGHKFNRNSSGISSPTHFLEYPTFSHSSGPPSLALNLLFRPRLPQKFLQIPQQRFCPLNSRKMSPYIMFPPPHQRPGCLHPTPRHRHNLVREPGEAKRLLDHPVRVFMRAYHAGDEELAVGVEGCGEAVCKPIEGDGFEDRVHTWSCAGI